MKVLDYESRGISYLCMMSTVNTIIAWGCVSRYKNQVWALGSNPM
ncbi:MAG: hypothetical protein TU36_000335 [Vulcanisaeta sp. AZ3]